MASEQGSDDSIETLLDKLNTDNLKKLAYGFYPVSNTEKLTVTYCGDNREELTSYIMSRFEGYKQQTPQGKTIKIAGKYTYDDFEAKIQKMIENQQDGPSQGGQQGYSR